jgi:dipeptidase E
MRILLGSGGFRTVERIANFRQRLVTHLGDVDQVLFIPYAHGDHDKYVQTMVDRGLHGGYDLVGIHRASNPRDAVADAQAIYVGGGNTFRLLDALYQYDLLDIIRERVHAGVPYIGVSAGSNVAGPTIKTTNDMPIVQPQSFDALGLVSFQLNPHYYTGVNWVKRANPLPPDPSPGGRAEEFVEHFSETRDDRLREFHEMNDTPVIGLWEGGVLLCDGMSVLLHDAPARVFRKGQPALDVNAGASLTELFPI